MRLPIVCMKDVKVGYLSPTCDQNEASAVRNFSHAVQSCKGVLSTHPEDFSLVLIGYFDSDTGVISPCEHFVLADGCSFPFDK